jgi:hypothetical protein
MHFATTCIDDFFKYPNAIRKYANSLEYNPDKQGRWPGVRSRPLHLLDAVLYSNICDKYLSNFYPIDTLMTGQVQYRAEAVFQKVSGKYGGGWIHNDREYMHATIFYLTPNISDDSGTSIFIPKKDSLPSSLPDGMTLKNKKKEQFYKSEISLEEAEADRLKNNRSLFNEVIRFSNVYNRCIGYDGSHWHAANNFANVNKEEERLTLVIFWSSIVGPSTGLQRTKMNQI